MREGKSAAVRLSGAGGRIAALGYNGLTLDSTVPGYAFFAPTSGAALYGDDAAGIFNFTMPGYPNATLTSFNPSASQISLGSLTLDSSGNIFRPESLSIQGSGAYYDSAAIGHGATSSNLSTALGHTSYAYQTNATAVGGGIATAAYAAAFGNASLAPLAGTVAMGKGTQARSWNAVVFGHYNEPVIGNSTAWQAGDAALVVGTGNSTVPANGLVIYNSGNTTFNGTAAVGQNLTVNGASIFNGTVTIEGNVTFSVSPPTPDISMGAFSSP